MIHLCTGRQPQGANIAAEVDKLSDQNRNSIEMTMTDYRSWLQTCLSDAFSPDTNSCNALKYSQSSLLVELFAAKCQLGGKKRN